jgi:hypothetical protein
LKLIREKTSQKGIEEKKKRGKENEVSNEIVF